MDITRMTRSVCPDYVTYTHQELKNLVASSEGLTKSLQSSDEATRQQAEVELNKRGEKLLNSGVTIHTPLDTKLQTLSKTAIQSKIGVNDIEGAIVVIQHHTHELVSLIGGKDYKKNIWKLEKIMKFMSENRGNLLLYITRQ